MVEDLRIAVELIAGRWFPHDILILSRLACLRSGHVGRSPSTLPAAEASNFARGGLRLGGSTLIRPSGHTRSRPARVA